MNQSGPTRHEDPGRPASTPRLGTRPDGATAGPAERDTAELGRAAEIAGARALRPAAAALIEAGFDEFVEHFCTPHDAQVLGAPLPPPSRYFRTHRVGYFEGIDSERGLEWLYTDNL
jgi:hypothetical protein